MSVQVQPPQPFIRYVDKEGRLTPEGILLLQRMVEAMADHEARIVTLEP